MANYVEAVIITKWVIDSRGVAVPDVVNEIFLYAEAGEYTIPVGPKYGSYSCLATGTGGHQKIFEDLAVFVARILMAVPVAQHFADDLRLFQLGYWVKDEEGNVVSHNWNTILPTEERTRVVNYITNNSKVTQAQLAAMFNATDTRAEIADKLRAFFST